MGSVSKQGVVPGVAVGERVELTVGEVVHGGWCVARLDEMFVVFVRHALPGERVVAKITQVTAKFARADAIEVREPAPTRVAPPCPYARAGGCGGCDWQHASLPAQRELKAEVVRQQLKRLAGLDTDVTVEPLPGVSGDETGLGWRTRVRFAVDGAGHAGLRAHRSHEVVRVSDCLIAHPDVTGAEVTRQSWPGATAVDVAVAPASGERAIMIEGKPRQPVSSPRFLAQHAAGRDWRVAAAGFWQVHPAAADTLATAVLEALRPRSGDTALDLFCGAGLFAGVLAEAVGPSGTVIAVEQDQAAVADARHNLRGTSWARVHRGDAAEVIGRIGTQGARIAVADPPRTGLPPALIDLLAAAPALERIGYVSCDPATLARDLKLFGQRGWHLHGLRAFDAFPMTHHVEALATLTTPAG
jgi:tRNA/tmRNA/rRNA uracil-C5-methylase (TrmA/RlmC/RlmD family)